MQIFLYLYTGLMDESLRPSQDIPQFSIDVGQKLEMLSRQSSLDWPRFVDAVRYQPGNTIVLEANPDVRTNDRFPNTSPITFTEIDLNLTDLPDLKEYFSSSPETRSFAIIESSYDSKKPKKECQDFFVINKKINGRNMLAILDYPVDMPKMVMNNGENKIPFMKLRLVLDMEKGKEKVIYNSENDTLNIGLIKKKTQVIDGWRSGNLVLLKDSTDPILNFSEPEGQKTPIVYGNLWQGLETILEQRKALNDLPQTEISSKAEKNEVILRWFKDRYSDSHFNPALELPEIPGIQQLLSLVGKIPARRLIRFCEKALSTLKLDLSSLKPQGKY